MLTISDAVMDRFTSQAKLDFDRRLIAWIHGQPELAAHVGKATPAWCDTLFRAGRGWNITLEEDLARLARLWLLRGEAWLQGDAARAILESQRQGELKVFQLECLDRESHRG